MTPNRQNCTDYEISDPSQLSSSPTVSVLMLAYNHEAYVRQAIESILAQEVEFPFEIVVGEDCSTDGTREILLEYQALRPDLVRIVSSDANVGMNRNLARILTTSRGAFIAICECDDYWVSSVKLAKQVSFLQSTRGASLVFSDRLVVSGSKVSSTCYEQRNYSLKDILEGFIPPTQTMMWRRSDGLIGKILAYPDNPSGDRLIAYHCALLGSIAKDSFVSAAYRVTGDGVWSSLPKKDHRRLKYLRLAEFHRQMGVNDASSLARCVEGLLLDSFHSIRKMDGAFAALGDVVYFTKLAGISRALAAVCGKFLKRSRQ
ncbi:glycosyltransferase [Pseudoxanthomonas koreensis]|uniref:glycosyltransferase n=1 Tax=Pseudoxanthomonas koreensis TaxID=266061 RepID=UPI002367D6AC|nr:glycosyltransferase [Pseudoxanthomonas koreensis]KAF1695302.1 hypothetical protein CSC64_03380 [Pseudoxanthomonas koreensis]